jgi:polyhydroxyalkanoate synthesis regulator phasin
MTFTKPRRLAGNSTLSTATEKSSWLLNAVLTAGALLFTVSVSFAQDDSPIIDALVKKGILTQQEADKLAAEAAKESSEVRPTNDLSNRLKIGDWVQELDIWGDIRFREYYNQLQPQLPPPPGATAYDVHQQKQRLRFRLRLNADFLLAGNFFGGVQLSTSDNRDALSQNATYTSGFDNYNIYISRAFVGWAPEPGLTFVAGRQENPFYQNDVFYGQDLAMNGLVERFDFHKLFGWSSGGEPSGYSKETKAVTPAPSPGGFPLELSLIAGQFIFFNNNANSPYSFAQTDAYQFQTQLLARLKLLNGALTVTEAPAIWIANDAGLGPTSPLPNGQPNPATAPVGGSGVYGSLNNTSPFPVSQRDEFFLFLPGDISFHLGSLPFAFYWDLSYNFWGDQRFNEVLGPLYNTVRYKGTTPIFSNEVSPSLSDKLAWLIGVRFGQNKKAGDWSFFIDYRQVGIASIDPNLNSDNFAESNLNAQGFRMTLAYNLTDFAVLAFTGWFSWNLTPNLYGGYATSPSLYPIANFNSDQTFAVDLNIKF